MRVELVPGVSRETFFQALYRAGFAAWVDGDTIRIGSGQTACETGNDPVADWLIHATAGDD